MEAQAVGEYIQQHSTSDTRIAVFGSEPEIYFYAQRPSATGYIYSYALMEPHPAALVMQREMAEEIETNHPAYVIAVRNKLSWLPYAQSHKEIFNWFASFLKNHYQKVAVVGINANYKVILVEKDQLTHLPPFVEEPLEIYKRIVDAD